jgi:hypothetical protein
MVRWFLLTLSASFPFPDSQDLEYAIYNAASMSDVAVTKS